MCVQKPVGIVRRVRSGAPTTAIAFRKFGFATEIRIAKVEPMNETVPPC